MTTEEKKKNSKQKFVSSKNIQLNYNKQLYTIDVLYSLKYYMHFVDFFKFPKN